MTAAAQPAPEDPASAPPLAQGLAAAAAELALAAEEAAALQRSLSPLLRGGGEGAEAFQALDALTQHIDGLRRFLDDLARDCPTAWRLDVRGAARRLPLHAQARRLAGEDADAGAADAPASGELELL